MFTRNTISAKTRVCASRSRFADVFNFFIYGGRQIIRPEFLVEENVQEDAVVFAEGEKTEVWHRYRDGSSRQCSTL